MRALIGGIGLMSLGLGYGSLAFGGDEMGNGGHVAACRHFNDISYQALDAYEARRMGLLIELNLRSDDVFREAAILLGRLEHLDPRRMERLLSTLSFMQRTHKIVDAMPFSRIEDFGNSPLEKNCELEQAIVQVQEPVDGTTFFIAERLWNLLDTSNRVILILHEVIYWDAIHHYRHATSIPSRQLNALIFSNAIAGMDEASYQDVLRSLEFDVARAGE